MNEEIFLEIIKAGVQAPSGDNLQPWIIEPDTNYNSFKLIGIKDKDDFFDVNNSAVYIDCGTFLENIRLAANYYDYGVDIKINEENDLFIANINFLKGKQFNEINRKLFKQIYKRATNRKSYRSEDLPQDFYSQMNQELNNYNNIKLRFVKNNHIINNILYKSDIIRYETQKAHETLYANVKFSKVEINSRVGLDYRTLGLPFPAKLIMKILGIWKFEQFLSLTKLNRISALFSTTKLLKKSAGIGIITMSRSSKKNLIHSGQVFERLWLLLTSYGGYLQPYASLPFFIRYIEHTNIKPFSLKNEKLIKELKNIFYKELNMDVNEELVMIFRYGITDNPQVYSLRKNVKNFIINHK